MNKQPVVLGPDVLDTIYHKWLIKNYNYNINYLKISYQQQPRVTERNQKFEEWLWKHGLFVIQINKPRYLHFFGDDKKLTLFLLKNT